MLIRYMLLFCLFFLSSVAWAQEVVINRIKIIGNSYTDEKVIRDYLPELSSGQRIDQSQLEGILRKVEKRLERTQYFYGTTTQIVPTQKDPTKVNIIVEVTEGFLYRFGGGSGFFAMGMANLEGQGRDAGVLIGPQVAYVQWQDTHVDRGHYELSGSVGYSPVLYKDHINTAVQDYKRVASVFLGKNISPEWTVGVNVEGARLFDDRYATRFDYLYPALRSSYLSIDDPFDPAQGARIDVSLGYVTGAQLKRSSLEARYYWECVPDTLVVASRLMVGMQAGSLGQDYFGYSLNDSNAIRFEVDRGYFGKQVMLISEEIRYRWLRGALLGFIDTTLEPVAFVDLGKAADTMSGMRDYSLQYAYGLGLRLMLGAPVYVPLRLELGWGAGGSAKVGVVVGAPF